MNSFQQNILTPKKQRYGRWTKQESALFEQLLQKYGKNWKQIQKHLKGRTLSQIRSHAQKFFAKIEPERVQFYQRKANLLLAQKILQEHKQLEAKQTQIIQQQQVSAAISLEEDQTLITQYLQPKQIALSEFMKEQLFKTPVIKEQNQINRPEYFYPFYPNNMSFFNLGSPENRQQYNQYSYMGFGTRLSNFKPYTK